MLPLCLLMLTAAAPKSVAVLEISAKVGIDQDRADIFAELVQEHLRNELGHKVIGRSDIQAMLGLEELKQQADCAESSECLAQIGGALGVEEIVVGTLAKLGSYLVVTLKRIDPVNAKVLAQSTRRLKEAGDDDLVEAARPMVMDLYAEEAAQRNEVAAAEEPPAHDAAQSEEAPLEASQVPEAPDAPEQTDASDATPPASASPSTKRAVDWPIRLGVSVGGGVDGQDIRAGTAFSALVWMEPLENFGIELGGGFPAHMQFALRYWFRFAGVFEVGPVVHFAPFFRAIHGRMGAFRPSLGAGAAVGVGFETVAGRFGVRLDGRYSRDLDADLNTFPIQSWIVWGL